MDGNLGRLRWRCRRGMKELDVLLRGYVDSEYRQAHPDQQEAFRRLLDCPDPVIYDLLLGRVRPPDEATASLVARIRATPPRAG